MAHPTVVINVVGLTAALIGAHSPHLRAFRDSGSMRVMKPVLPAVTCSVQASMLTGWLPRDHGIVGNGWYNREYGEVQFWKQSNKLMHGDKVWDIARQRDPSFTCANMFWWYNMNTTADIAVTPRPIYKADGRKIPDIYTSPPELRDQIQGHLIRFPLFYFWGPGANIKSSQWITEASMFVWEMRRPTLMLIYLPHLDYDFQRFGPNGPEAHAAVKAVDELVGDLVTFFRGHGVRIIIVSEYGIEPVEGAVHINRLLREEGALRVREEDGGEVLDPIASRAFAVADHQIAHVYVRDPKEVERYATLLRSVAGVQLALTRGEQETFDIINERAGDIVLVAEQGRWFSYMYWLTDERAPDFARTVDIHRKPGYDPLELFFDPAIRAPKMRVVAKRLVKYIGMRTLMDVVPLDTKLVRGSHGRVHVPQQYKPVLLAERELMVPDEPPCTVVRDVILSHLFDDAPA